MSSMISWCAVDMFDQGSLKVEVIGQDETLYDYYVSDL